MHQILITVVMRTEYFQTKLDALEQRLDQRYKNLWDLRDHFMYLGMWEDLEITDIKIAKLETLIEHTRVRIYTN